MNEQQHDMFGIPPMAHARRADPATSHKAAAEMNAGGRTEKHADIVAKMVAAHPGLTSAELALKDKRLTHPQIHKRLRDLARAGRIIEGATRRCRVHQRESLTWSPA